MPDTPPDDKGMLQEHLNKALEEAWSKTNLALNETSQGSEGFEKKIWAAAESVEYSSLLFSLTYDLEDMDPPVDNRKGDDPIALVKDSLESLKRAREMRARSSEEAYTNLRTAAHYLKTAYLDRIKRATRSR